MSEDEPVKEVVPEPGDKPVGDPVPPPVEPKPDHELHTRVSSLESTVTGLQTMIENIVSDGDPEQDKGPVRKPWTHWSPGAR